MPISVVGGELVEKDFLASDGSAAENGLFCTIGSLVIESTAPPLDTGVPAFNTVSAVPTLSDKRSNTSSTRFLGFAPLI
jgi:hypothetical protein